MMVGKNLVLGAAIGYSFDKIRNFVISLKETSFNGDVGIIVSHEQHDAIAALEKLEVRVFYLEGKAFYRVHPSQSRFFKIFEILQESKDNYNMVFLSDIRDVVFQSDPFSRTNNNDITVFLEDKSQTIGSCQYNRVWIKILFGRKILKKMGDSRISCCGTVLGTMNGMCNYLKEMINVAEQSPKKSMEMFGVDQGIHNFMIYNKLLKNLEISENQELVFTMHHSSSENFSVDRDGVVVNSSGDVSAVIHQYDRFQELFDMLNDKYLSIYNNKYKNI